MREMTAITIGNFDGVHRGHAALIQAARRAAGVGGRVVALAFDPHPMTILRPEITSSRLSRFEQRERWLKGTGADEVALLRPTREFLHQQPEDFVSRIVAQYAPAAIVEGPDFRFGHKRAGSADTLRHLETKFGYRTIVLDPIDAALADQSIVRISSSMVRWLIERGRMNDAAALLGRPYELQCAVVEGDKRGRTLGMPTINLAHEDYLLPADGIYAGWAIVPDGHQFPAAISVGTKPTFGAHPRICEAHLIGYRAPLDEYGWTVRLSIERWLRDQLIFAGVEGLTQQLRRDLERITPGQTAAAIGSPAGSRV